MLPMAKAMLDAVRDLIIPKVDAGHAAQGFERARHAALCIGMATASHPVD